MYSNMSSYGIGGDDMSSAPMTMPMGSPDTAGNQPRSGWGQHHRIIGKPFFRHHRGSHEELMGLRLGDVNDSPLELFFQDWKHTILPPVAIGVALSLFTDLKLLYVAAIAGAGTYGLHLATKDPHHTDDERPYAIAAEVGLALAAWLIAEQLTKKTRKRRKNGRKRRKRKR